MSNDQWDDPILETIFGDDETVKRAYVYTGTVNSKPFRCQEPRTVFLSGFKATPLHRWDGDTEVRMGLEFKLTGEPVGSTYTESDFEEFINDRHSTISN